MPRIVHFEISADDLDRAKTFYSSVFGWEFQSWGGPPEYYLVNTGPSDQPGINGGMFKRMGPVGHVNSIDVPSIDEYVAKITEQGGQAVTPKTTIPGMGYQIYCQDTEGNLFGLHQADPEAKEKEKEGEEGEG